MPTETPAPKNGRPLVDYAAYLAAAYAGVRLLAFGIDKVLGIGSSIQGFQQIGAGWGVDPTGFRYFVGVQELLVGLGLVSALLLFIPPSRAGLARVRALGKLGVRLGGPGLVATMIGAIATELLIRPGQQDWLLYLAIQLIAIGFFLTGWTIARFGVPFVRRAPPVDDASRSHDVPTGDHASSAT